MGGPVQSVELLLDTASEAVVRHQWRALAEAGLASLHRHTGESNAPHVTLAVRQRIPPELDGALAGAVTGLPVPLVLGGLLVFCRRRCVLARAVVPSRELLDLQSAVHEVLEAAGETTGPSATHLAPGAWTPHVTLARNLTVDEVGTAVAALGAVADARASATAVRRWDALARRTWLLPT